MLATDQKRKENGKEKAPDNQNETIGDKLLYIYISVTFIYVYVTFIYTCMT